MEEKVNMTLVNQYISQFGYGDTEKLNQELNNLVKEFSNLVRNMENIHDTIRGQTDLSIFIEGQILSQLTEIQNNASITKSTFDKITIDLLGKLQHELNKIKYTLTSDTVNDNYEKFLALNYIWEEIIEKNIIKFTTYTKSFNSLAKNIYKGASNYTGDIMSLNCNLYIPTIKILIKDLSRKFNEYLKEYDYEGKIRFFIKTTPDAVEVVSEDEFNIDELSDEVVNNLDIKDAYKYYVKSKSSIVELEPLINDYFELPQIDYDVLINNVFKKFTTVSMIKLKLDNSEIPTLSIDEIMSNTTKYLNKPVKFRAIVSSLLKPGTRLFKAKIHKKEGDEIAYFILPQSTFVDKTGRKVKIVPNDEENIEITMQRGTLLPLPEETENFGSQMQTIPFVIEGDLVNKLQIGERYTFYGIPFRDDPSKVESQIVILITNAKPYKRKEVTVTENDIKYFKTLKNKKNLLEMLITSYAPHIKHTKPWDNVWSMKLASLIVAVGVPNNISKKYRSTMNILFIGYPGVAKSVIATELQEIVDKVLYASGKGASGVGITASVVKDEITGKRTVQAGVIVLANNGIAIIDEFDKIKPEDRDMLYEALEKMQITVSKYGLYVILPAKTSVIAVANFDEATQRQINETGEIDLNMAIRRMRIHEALFSRFDLVLLAYDIPDEEKDQQIAKHIINAMFNRLENTPLDYTMLAKYIQYVKTINPEIPPEIEQKLINKYVEYRKNYRKRVFTARQLISLIRVTLAIARLKQHEVVTEDDLEDTIKLFEMSESVIEEATTVKTIDEEELKEEVYILLKDMKSYPSISFDNFMRILFSRVNYSDEIKQEVTEKVKELLLTRFRKNIELLGTEMSSLLENSEVPVFRVKKI